MIHLPHDADLVAGTWRFADRDGERIVKLRCPSCGVEGDLTDHAIDDFGRVEPSLMCPRRCGFHARVLLEDWTYQRLAWARH